MFELGELETEVMDRLWAADTMLSVHDLVERLSESRRLAYTTVLTVVTHLHEKGWVEREKRQRAYFYQPTRGRAEAVSNAIREILDQSNCSIVALEHLAGTLSREEFDAVQRGWESRSAQVPGSLG
ncbi:BlaI/MecI/CopY family transcriptional regulator [Antrihabitans sp. YC2-6]|uniref:BlaI/MecI/CopY family transcriptional regulator n=1 Tax=Antrihabitans sp. YC2-6 TaxID=2799498 RepID=UPI0018F4C4D5|nr:BlaI/MecI/CopY family transcriptional regulator [Antrihabitans sp. YC2-6]MBJ8348456.1 BlaI/MecI/CopY family transcriptional regulator [Antrihabitans sp. YC2-6]